MENVAELLPVMPSIEQLGRIIGNVAAPAFLLGAVASFVAFISALINVAHEYGVAILFVAALSVFCASLIDLAREIRIELHENDCSYRDDGR